VDYADAQRRLLVRGVRKDGTQTVAAPGAGLGSATGMAYIQGSEGLSDLASLLSRYTSHGAPQPDRLHFNELWSDAPLQSLRIVRAAAQRGEAVLDVFMTNERAVFSRYQWYKEHLRPLLSDMNETFAALSQRFTALPQPRGLASREALQDLAVPAEMLSLRCQQVLALYDYAAHCMKNSSAWCNDTLANSRAALDTARSLVAGREANYGLANLGPGAEELVFGWGKPVPTAYAFGYLWAAHTLFYWQRDQAIVEKRILDPCFATINNPVELGLQGGGGKVVRYLQELVRWFLSNRMWHVDLSGCLGPEKEPSPLESPLPSASAVVVE